MSASNLPSVLKSKLPSRVVNSIRSNLPSILRKASKVPLSKIPKSFIPKSSLPPSRLAPSKIPPSKIPKSKIPISKSGLPPVPPIFIKTFKNKKVTPRRLKRYNKVDVYVKKTGQKKKFTRINYGYLTYTQAKNLGRFLADKTRLASYILRPSILNRRQKFTTKTAAFKFRAKKVTSKLPRVARIEKRKYRIDTVGEKKQISLKGLKKIKSEKSIIKRILKKKKPKKETFCKKTDR